MEFEFFASGRVGESQVRGVEHDSWKKKIVLAPLLFVDRIPGQRISQMLHVNPYLMGPAGEEGDIQEGIALPVRSHDPVSRLGRLSPGSDGKFLSVPIGSADGGINETAPGWWNPYGQGNIAF